MVTISNRLKSIMDYQLLYGSFSTDQSLLNGKSGLSLFFFCCARITNNRFYESFAEELVEDVCGHLTFDLAVDFADGLCGIGWSVEFLKRLGFVEGDTDEILEEIDAKVMERDLRRIKDTSFEHGLEGIAAYIRARMDSPGRESGKQPFDVSYMEEFKEACRKAKIDWQSHDYECAAIWKRALGCWRETAGPGESNSWKHGMILLDDEKKMDTIITYLPEKHHGNNYTEN